MDIPKMISVESSNLDSVGYDGQNLFVEFRSGSIYVYYGVPKQLYNELLDANSKGIFLNRNIKDIYPFEKIQ